MAKMAEADELLVTVVLEDYAGYETSLLAQHGVAFALDVVSGKARKRILFDVGQSSEPVLRNMETLGIAPESIDLIALSHCHYDHTGGLVGVLQAIGHPTPVVAHPSLFRPHFVTASSADPSHWLTRELGVPPGNGPAEIAGCGGQLRPMSQPFELMPGVLWTGQIERTTEFESTPTLATQTLLEGHVVEDAIEDDSSLAVNVRGKGLFVVSGCSHAGIANIVKHALSVSAVPHVHTVIGGFHLIEASEQRQERTAKELRRLGVRRVYSGHCTGFAGEMALCHEFGEAFEKLHCGKRIDSSAR